MRRGLLLAVLAVLAATAAGGFAVASGRGDAPARPAAANVPAPADPTAADRAAEPPPLPEMRPRVVEPVAGDPADPAAPAPDDPGLEKVGPAPTRAASGRTRRAGSPAGVTPAPDRAVALPNGIALPPLEAPEAVKRIIEAGNVIARSPYKWGGGHGRWLDTGYDCSGSVSFALAAAGLLDAPLASGPLMSWGEPGRGRWVTIYTNPGHVFMDVAGIRFDTSARRVTGSRWENAMRSTDGYVARHPAGL